MVKARQDCPTRNNRRTSLAAALALLARDASAANVGDPPRNLSAYPVIGQATLNWDAPTSGTPTGYRIQQRVSWGEWTNLVDDTTTRREYVDTSIEHNTSYPYRIRVIYSNGTSGPSNAVKSRSPKNEAPPKPHSIRLNKLSNNVSIRWKVSRKNGYNGIEKIEIKRRVSGDDPPGQYTTLATITTKANVRPPSGVSASYTDTATQSGKTYLYRPYATNSAGASRRTRFKPVTIP